MTRHIPLIILAFLALVGCEMKNQKSSSYLIVYSQDEYYELLQENKHQNIKVVDTACINARKRAISDINAGKLYYFHSNVWYEWKEMAALLSKYNIEFKDLISSCITPLKGFEYNCYEDVMWSEIDRKIGKYTIDSLWKVAERNFILKYPDSVYIKDGIDIRKKLQYVGLIPI